MIVYKYLFYRLYAWSLWFESPDSQAPNLWFNITMLLIFNLLSLGYLLEIILKKSIRISGVYTIPFFVLPGLFVYFKSINKRQYLSYQNSFLHHTKAQNCLGNIIVGLYCFASVVGFFICITFIWLIQVKPNN